MPAKTDHRVRLTKSVVDRMGSGDTLWDAHVRGFGVRCQRQAKKYILKTRVNGRQRWITIGEHGSPWTPGNARKQALRLLGEVHSGAGVEELRQGKQQQATMADLSRRYIDDYALQHKKPSSVRMDQKNIANHVLPLLGSKLVAEVSRTDIDAFKRSVRDGKTAPKNTKGPAPVIGVAPRCLAGQASPTAASR